MKVSGLVSRQSPPAVVQQGPFAGSSEDTCFIPQSFHSLYGKASVLMISVMIEILHEIMYENVPTPLELW